MNETKLFTKKKKKIWKRSVDSDTNNKNIKLG